eukprot:309146-Alexandrium_andersonii.AAC.1
MTTAGMLHRSQPLRYALRTLWPHSAVSDVSRRPCRRSLAAGGCCSSGCRPWDGPAPSAGRAAGPAD